MVAKIGAVGVMKKEKCTYEEYFFHAKNSQMQGNILYANMKILTDLQGQGF